MRGVNMTVPQETILKLQLLPADKVEMVSNFIDQLVMTCPVEIFDAVRRNGVENPLTDEEIKDFISDVRDERNAACN